MRRRNRITLARPFMLTPEQVSTAKPSQFLSVAPQMNTFKSAMARNIYVHINNGFFTITLSITKQFKFLRSRVSEDAC